MTKQVVCPVCNGHGFISVIGENYSSSHTCDHCNGSGEIEIPMTNADRIRAMNDEELAEFLEGTHTNMAIRLGGEYIVRAKEYIEIWLKQPAEVDNGKA